MAPVTSNRPGPTGPPPQLAPRRCRPTGYDLVGFFDSFHDLGNPWAAACARSSVADDGTLLLVEPLAVTGSRTASARGV